VKRRAEYLVEKRDGRREWLSATKLARSIHVALVAAQEPEVWRAGDLAEAVLTGVRVLGRLRGVQPEVPLPTPVLAGAVQRVLVAAGMPLAAAAYAQVRAERRRRREVVREIAGAGHATEQRARALLGSAWPAGRWWPGIGS
jgi:hypothetical protein